MEDTVPPSVPAESERQAVFSNSGQDGLKEKVLSAPWDLKSGCRPSVVCEWLISRFVSEQGPTPFTSSNLRIEQ